MSEKKIVAVSGWTKPQQVVCAAVRGHGVIVCGARHFDKVMRLVIDKYVGSYRGWEQGFIDQKGQFLTRKEAFLLADKRGQIKQSPMAPDGVLISEDIY